MLNMRQKSVNVDRLELITVLKKNRELHKQQYEEAVNDYRQAIYLSLQQALEDVKICSNEELLKLRVQFNVPVSHLHDYDEVIEIMEVSVDKFIQIDNESFRAYYKNEWAWSESFNATYLSNKTLAGALHR
ncbi:hypothetical protein [Ralstonia phage RP13]|nr:hypothetical protein [Ralstonia phage RP13]